VDLIVHTKPMYQEFKEAGGFFFEEIFQRGVILL
jgi:hypothetical protein